MRSIMNERATSGQKFSNSSRARIKTTHVTIALRAEICANIGCCRNRHRALCCVVWVTEGACQMVKPCKAMSEKRRKMRWKSISDDDKKLERSHSPLSFSYLHLTSLFFVVM